MKSSKFLLLLTIASAAFSLATIILLHFLRSDYDPISRYVSEYAIGSYGQLAALSFSAFGISIVSFYLQARKKFSRGINLILVWGIALIILGFFASDLKRTHLSFHGTVHILLTGIGFGAFSIGSFFLSGQFKKYTSIFKKLSWITLVFLLLLALGLMGDKLYAYNLSVPFPLSFLSDVTGLTERIALVSSSLWLFLAVYQLWKKN